MCEVVGVRRSRPAVMRIEKRCMMWCVMESWRRKIALMRYV